MKNLYSLLILCLLISPVEAAKLPDVLIGENDTHRFSFDCDQIIMDVGRCYSELREETGIRRVYLKIHGIGVKAGEDLQTTLLLNCAKKIVAEFTISGAGEWKSPKKDSVSALVLETGCRL